MANRAITTSRSHRRDRLEMPPNIFALADDTYRTMLTEADVTYVAVQLIDGERRPVPIRGPE